MVSVRWPRNRLFDDICIADGREREREDTYEAYKIYIFYFDALLIEIFTANYNIIELLKIAVEKG